ncbi:MAG: hypothetical protein ACRDQH_05635 [Pseudonocardiaceae bacterium]
METSQVRGRVRLIRGAGEAAPDLSLLVRNGLAPAMRDGLRRGWSAALTRFNSCGYTDMGLPAHTRHHRPGTAAAECGAVSNWRGAPAAGAAWACAGV